MSVKNVTAMTCAVLVGSVLAFGGPAAADKVRVGYAPSVWDPSDFHGMMGSGIEAGLKEKGVDYEFMIRAPANHVAHEEQLAIVENMIAEKVDVIIINPTDPEAQRVAYQKVLEAGIPLIVGNYSVPFPDDWGFQPMMFSGYSHSDAGVVLAHYLAEKHGAGTTIAIIHGAPGHITYERAPKDLYAELGLRYIEEGLLTAAWIRDPVSMGKAVGEAIWLVKEGRTDEARRSSTRRST